MMLREHATNAQLASATAELRDAKEALRTVEHKEGVALAELEAAAASTSAGGCQYCRGGVGRE